MSSIRIKRLFGRGGDGGSGSPDAIRRSNSQADIKDKDKNEISKEELTNTRAKSNPKRLKNRSLSNKELKMITVMKEKNFAASRRHLKFDWAAEPQQLNDKKDLGDLPLSSKRAGEPLKMNKGQELSKRQKEMRMQYLQLIDSIEQAIGEILDILSEVNRVLTDERERASKSSYSIVSLSSIVKDIKKIWDSETEYYEFEKKDNTNFIYVMEKIQQLPHNVKIPPEKLEALSQVTTITIKEIHAEFNSSLEVVTNNSSVAQAIALARKLRSVRKFLLGDVGSSNALSNLSRSTRAGIGGQVVRLQSLLKKEADTTSSAIEAEEQVLHGMQEQVTASNTERYLIKLALRNLDRKIHLIIRSRKMQLEEELMDTEYEEVLQFFDEQTQENPLGKNKEIYERFVSIIRSEPRYITRLLPYLSYSDSDTLVQTITFSLFSDLSLGTEEALLLSVMERIMRAEFQEIKTPREFLRGTSFVSRLLSSYCVRQGGRTHLLQVLKEPIMAILNDSELSLEMDPQKIYLSMYDAPEEEVLRMDPTEIRKMPKVMKKIKKHQDKLNQVCKYFLSTIIKSLPTMPFGMRWLGKLLAQMNLEAVGEGVEATEERDILLGSYIFLRYYSPAIITPEEYGILPMTTPSYESRRNLLHIAKVIQNLANHCPFGEKEPWMVPMNRFLKANESVLTSYFDQLINVGEPTYLFKRKDAAIQKTIAISPNELFLLANRVFDNINTVLGPETEEEKINRIVPKQVSYSTPSYTPLTATPTGSVIRAGQAASKGKDKIVESSSDEGAAKEKEKEVLVTVKAKEKEGEKKKIINNKRTKKRTKKKGHSEDSEESENESGSELKTASTATSYSESESDGGNNKNKIDRIVRSPDDNESVDKHEGVGEASTNKNAEKEDEKEKEKQTLKLSVRRNTIEKQRDWAKERRKLKKWEKENARRRKEKLPELPYPSGLAVSPVIKRKGSKAVSLAEELNSLSSQSEPETEIVEIEVEHDAREDPLFDLLMKLQPVPPLFPKRRNKYLLLKIDDQPFSKEANEPEMEPAAQKFKRTCETLRSTLCMLGPLDEILDDEDSHSIQELQYANGHNTTTSKKGNAFLIEAVTHSEEREKAKARMEKGKEKEKDGNNNNNHNNHNNHNKKGKGKEAVKFSDKVDEVREVHPSHKAGWVSMNILQMLEQVKARVKPDDLSSIVTLLHVSQEKTSKDNLKKSAKIPKAKAMQRLFKTIKKLKQLPEECKKDDFAALITALEQDYQRRKIYLSFLCTEKVEILQSLQHLQKEVDSLYEEKAIYTEYLYNIQLKAFLARRRSKDIIGPFQYKISEMVRQGIVVAAPTTQGKSKGKRTKRNASNPSSPLATKTSTKSTKRGTKGSSPPSSSPSAVVVASSPSHKHPAALGDDNEEVSDNDPDRGSEHDEQEVEELPSSTRMPSHRHHDDEEGEAEGGHEEQEPTDGKSGPRMKRNRSYSDDGGQGSAISTSSSVSTSAGSSRRSSFSSNDRAVNVVADMNNSAQYGGTLKMSCTSPGSVNLVVQTPGSHGPQFFEMQLSSLMDELLTHDTVTYGDITFDLRKIISFISKNLTG